MGELYAVPVTTWRPEDGREHGKVKRCWLLVLCEDSAQLVSLLVSKETTSGARRGVLPPRAVVNISFIFSHLSGEGCASVTRSKSPHTAPSLGMFRYRL